jgi:hypothetical protein
MSPSATSSQLTPCGSRDTTPSAPHNDTHSDECNRGTREIPASQWHTLDPPQPDQRDGNVDPAISGVHTPGGGGM